MQTSESEYGKDNVEEMTSDKANDDIEHVIHDREGEVDTPTVSMSFSNMNEVHAYMTKYACSKGFGIVKFHNTKDDEGQIKRQTYACNCAGVRKQTIRKGRGNDQSLECVAQ